MKHLLLLLVSAFLLSACGGVKKTQQALNEGNYNEVISKAVRQLQKNKDRKAFQPYILMLEDGYAKSMVEIHNHINFLERSDNASNYKEIYETYFHLKELQDNIKPLLPLYITEENRNAQFKFENYSERILVAKSNLSHHIYTTSVASLNIEHSKNGYRAIYDDLKYLNQINPNYKDVAQLMNKVHDLGTNYILVDMDNRSNVIMPRLLEQYILNFNTYGIDDFWTVYHNTRVTDFDYDFKLDIELRDIAISPEEISERVINRERRIKDGWEYVFDADGNHVLDDDGNKVKRDLYKTVRARYFEYTQTKSAVVSGQVTFVNLETRQVTDTFPLTSEFVFENAYSNYRGDVRALTSDMRRLLQFNALPFPTNEQMVYDTGEDLKANIKRIVTRKNYNS